MKTMEVTFWNEAGSLVRGEIVNAHTIRERHDDGSLTLDIRRDAEIDVLSDQQGTLCAYKVPMSRVRFWREVAA